MTKKLLFIDIDGTLTKGGENIPPKSALQAIKATQEKGNLVFLCTGRNRGMLAPLLQYNFDGYVGCGGGLVEVQGNIIYDHPMTSAQRDLAMKVLKDNGVFRTIESKDVTYGDENLGSFLEAKNETNSEIERWRKALSESLGIVPISTYDGHPIYKVVIMCEKEEQLSEARKYLEKDFNFVIHEIKEHNSCLNGDLVNRAFDKGRAIQKVCDYLQIPIEDTYGFGDSMNDLEMLEIVGHSICMGNGAQALKDICEYVTDTVENDGLYKAFEEFDLL